MPGESDPLAEIRRLYFAASKATIARDFDRAIDLLKAMANDDERERAAVFMDGLAQMRSEWGVRDAERPAKGRGPARGGAIPIPGPRPGGRR